ncbi:hypothetical protein L6654_33140 [Bradyrhizobium sp. WYCCWR 13023]|uniref:Uncharacterized protein n=1 Tax=Bradyrhizobium zhengyangense TaxID=2911009 RepID=A0A9X1UAQ4_9BRAD|nr:MULTISPECIES: hypothetical protein [Bradyrhizobium]MCG2631485.1 hypothetical protein [Bradyrhizobium zhengyangense]MCG2671345.1 hypothetical protein [Bradyrhizobium zhengyangense]
MSEKKPFATEQAIRGCWGDGDPPEDEAEYGYYSDIVQIERLNGGVNPDESPDAETA